MLIVAPLASDDFQLPFRDSGNVVVEKIEEEKKAFNSLFGIPGDRNGVSLLLVYGLSTPFSGFRCS